jgi:regulatory protein
MPVITSIKPQKNQKRVNIYLDGKFAFGLDLENFVKYGLKVEQELSKEEVEEIIKKAEFNKVYDKILKFASLRPRSEKEFRIWLKKHKVPISLNEELFNRLKHLDFLNDKKFVVWWVNQRQTFRPKSKRILGQELRLKGIGRELIDEVLKDEGVDETSAAKRILSKKSYMWKNLSGFEKRVKMGNYLARNGYSWDTIRKVLDEFDQE